MERLALTVEEAAQSIGIGRTKMYELINSGMLRSIKIGGQRRIRVDDLKAWIAAQQPDVVPTSELLAVLQMPTPLASRTYTRRRRTQE